MDLIIISPGRTKAMVRHKSKYVFYDCIRLLGYLICIRYIILHETWCMREMQSRSVRTPQSEYPDWYIPRAPTPISTPFREFFIFSPFVTVSIMSCISKLRCLVESPDMTRGALRGGTPPWGVIFHENVNFLFVAKKCKVTHTFHKIHKQYVIAAIETHILVNFFNKTVFGDYVFLPKIKMVSSIQLNILENSFTLQEYHIHRYIGHVQLNKMIENWTL